MQTKLRLVFTITIAFLSFYGSAQDNYWEQKSKKGNVNKNFSSRFKVNKGQSFTCNEALFKKGLAKITTAKNNTTTVYFPDINGELVAFNVSESSVLSPKLSHKYPNIKSYAGKAIGQNTKVRFSVSHKGIQSTMVSADGKETVFMQKDSGNNYILYSRDPNAAQNADIICSTKELNLNKVTGLTRKIVDDQMLRKYRLAVTASGEYTQFHGGTVADALASINATVTRINMVFETDLGVTLELVANTDEVIFTDAEDDPYSGNLSPKVQNELDNTIGSANYDIGILFNQSNQSDGNAGFIGAVCVDEKKGSAYATGVNPQGDLYDLDFVAHEMGHQFGANHTWSYETESGSTTQVEPASGTTIMGYAGIVGIENVATNGDDYFHYVSIVQISDYLETTSCAETINLVNSPPVIVPTGSYSIPKSTAFVLSAEATDIDVDDVLTFTWEQIDNGVVPTSAFGPNNPFGANFRSQKPSTNPERYFPNLSSVLTGQLTQSSPTIGDAWETVSDVERELNFALTVRDNGIEGGQVVSDLVNIFVENSAGPFVVTSQETSATKIAGSVETVTWDVANTHMEPINAQQVDLLLSLDGGLTYPVILAENVDNDGSHDILLPGMPTTEARIMIKPSDNIFFAVNAADFTIEASDIVLHLEKVVQEVCKGDILVVPFSYETYNGFNEEATFSVATPPEGVDISIFPETAMANNTPFEITFTETDSLDTGSYPIRVIATTPSITKEVVFDLKVFDTNFAETSLLLPVNNMLDESTKTILEWQQDQLATGYDVEIATDIAFTSIIETASVFGTTYSPQNLEHETSYFWRVKPENSCGEGAFGTPNQFTTIVFNCKNVGSEDLPLPISTTGMPTVISEVEVFDDLVIADINVNLNLEHDYLSDLTVTLTSPAGTSVVLFNNSCNDFKDVSATFDDDAQAFICSSVSPAIQDTVKPLGALSTFIGESSFGVWTLTVADNAPADGGAFISFSLDLCAEGEFRPDVDGDGVFDDGPDLCLGTPNGLEVDVNGCEVLIFPASNFTVELQSESCRSSNDGAITLNVKEALEYTITVTGNGINNTEAFSAPTYILNNLEAGTYSLCINAVNEGVNYREQCFEAVVREPEILSVSAKTSLDGRVIDLQLQGASIYNVELNGVVTQTESSDFSLRLKEGTNTLKVTSNLACQGVYEEQFFFTTKASLYPNPTNGFATLAFSPITQRVRITIFSANGRFISSQNYEVNGQELELDMSHLSTGMYFVKYNAENNNGTIKVMKK